jgi:hypothetical protein
MSMLGPALVDTWNRQIARGVTITLYEKDGHANCKERKCPCNLIDVEQDPALHISLLGFDCHGRAWTVPSGKLCEV